MIKIVKTIAVAVAITCMFAMASGEASAQCARGGFNSGFVGGGFNSGFRGSGFNSGFRGGGFNSGFRGGGFNSGFGGVNRGLSVNFNSRSSNFGRSNFNRIPGRSFNRSGKFGY